MSILKINNLEIINSENNKIIKKLSLTIGKNSFTTVIGNSNSGKTLLIDAIFNLLPKGFKRTSGDILYNKESIFDINDYDDYRGNQISVIFNHPGIIFNSNYKIEKQIVEMLLLKKIFSSKKEIRKKLYYYLELLDIERFVVKKYPHEVNNKNIKKIAIIFSLLFNPKLLIIDDSFHGLDSITVKLIYLLLKEVKDKLTILFFTSINSSIVKLSDTVHYLYNGHIMESINYSKLNSYKLIHPYRRLFNNEVNIFQKQDDLTEVSKGCIYYNLCFRRKHDCLNFDNTLKEYENEHFLSCMNLED